MSQLENINHSINDDLCLDSMKKKFEFLKKENVGKQKYSKIYSNSEKIVIKSYFLSKDENESISNDTLKSLLSYYINIRHPCILPIINYSRKDPSSPLMVSMPYMENGSLADTLHNGQSDDTWKATTIAGIVTGMKYLHTKELYRGNLTPNNILINKEGHPQISDYLCHRLSKSRII